MNAKMAAAWRDRLSHRCHILETDNDSHRFKAGFGIARQERQETSPLTTL